MTINTRKYYLFPVISPRRARLFFAGFLCLAVGAGALSEKEAILLALSRHPDIRIQAFSLTRDSLDLALAKSAAGPRVVLSGINAAEYHPAITRDFGAGASTHQEFSGNLSAEASTQFIGGGALRLSAANGYGWNSDSGRTVNASELKLLFE